MKDQSNVTRVLKYLSNVELNIAFVFIISLVYILFDKSANYNSSNFTADLVDYTETTASILKLHKNVTVTERSFTTGETLAFVTPWNGDGYDIAKEFSKKFTMLSPVWFQLLRKGSKKYTIEGDQDVDLKWIEAVRKLNPTVKIVPRFRFHKWTEKDYVAIFDGDDVPKEAEIVAELLKKYCKKYKFDGVVLEIELPHYLQRFVTVLGHALQSEELTSVLVVPSSHNLKRSQTKQMFDAQALEVLGSFIDYFCLMTYDHAQDVGPNAPIEFVYDEITSICQGETCSKILVGLAFYGYDFVMSKNKLNGESILSHTDPIFGNNIIVKLRKHQPVLQWDDKSKEAFFKYTDKGVDHVAYIPTLKSVRERVDLIKKLGCGISIWEIGQGLDYYYNAI
ncbi:hypothetical protein MP638_006664 [Amoeboaphelidium occidentale]|nr:hypothetical protein MP638_006664 [Amoeboaphelidium occidentale]